MFYIVMEKCSVPYFKFIIVIGVRPEDCEQNLGPLSPVA